VTSRSQGDDLVKCVHCGMSIGAYRHECPFCREETQHHYVPTSSHGRLAATAIERARSQVDAGQFVSAMSGLAEMASIIQYTGSRVAAREARDIVATCIPHLSADGRRQGEQTLRELDRITQVSEVPDTPVGQVEGCVVVAAAGMDLAADADRRMNLTFRSGDVVLAPADEHEPSAEKHFPWQGLELSIEGAGRWQRGGGFFGGGFGLIGMGVGMLTATALNSLTSRTGIETFVHLQTQNMELYLYYGDATPDELRRRLAAVSLRLRQENTKPEAGESENAVDRLHKLADLLERGLIDDAEFARLKADMLKDV
jgi:hypothetical protein